MDSVRVGRQIRALRRRRGWRQLDLATNARVSRSAVSRMELGRSDRVAVWTLESVARALGARLEVGLSWNGEALDRLLDAGHAGLVELIAARLQRLGWEVAVEVSFNMFGERGSIDVLAFHVPTGTLLAVEVKSVVPDIQATILTLDRKSRVARRIALDRGWRPTAVARLLAIGEDRTARRRVDQHRAIFEAAFPVRGTEVNRWLASPDAARPISGLVFLSGDRGTVARHRVGHPQRPQARSCRAALRLRC
jgi:transcriptional regulator with XRE-family HTH domain